MRDTGNFLGSLHNIKALLTLVPVTRIIRDFPCHAPPVLRPEVFATTS